MRVYTLLAPDGCSACLLKRDGPATTGSSGEGLLCPSLQRGIAAALSGSDRTHRTTRGRTCCEGRLWPMACSGCQSCHHSCHARQMILDPSTVRILAVAAIAQRSRLQEHPLGILLPVCRAHHVRRAARARADDDLRRDLVPIQGPPPARVRTYCCEAGLMTQQQVWDYRSASYEVANVVVSTCTTGSRNKPMRSLVTALWG